MVVLKTEKVSAYTHIALVPVMAAGTIILVILAGRNFPLQISLLIYGFSAMILFSASYLFHSKLRSEYEQSLWWKIDRSAIFALIAGTYTPMCFLYLDGVMMWGILIAQWTFVLLGIVFSFFTNAPRMINTMIYLAMGWLVIIPFKTLVSVMPVSILFLLVAGGIFYTAGALVYAFKKPDGLPLNIGFHEVFHLFVNAGAVSHLLMLITGVVVFKHA